MIQKTFQAGLGFPNRIFKNTVYGSGEDEKRNRQLYKPLDILLSRPCFIKPPSLPDLWKLVLKVNLNVVFNS